MQRFKTLVFIGWLLLPFMTSTYAFAASSMIPTSKNKDISEVLNQKLNQYDRSRSNPRSTESKFSLNYSKNYGTMSQSSMVQNPIMEQQNKVNAFKSVNKGPRSNEDFYGFSMKIPLESK